MAVSRLVQVVRRVDQDLAHEAAIRHGAPNALFFERLSERIGHC
jgi:hypothetical protein